MTARFPGANPKQFEDHELPEDLRLGPFRECPGCGGNRMVFIKPYARYFCLDCRKYAAKDYQPPPFKLEE